MAGRLVGDIITSNKLFAANATALLATGGVVWSTNVIAFGLWYWDLDRGAAAARAHHPRANPAFVFAEMQYLPVRRWLLQRWTAWIHPVWAMKLTLARGRMVT